MSTQEVWTIGKVSRWAADDFRARGMPSPRLDAELLLAHVLGIDRIRILIDADKPLSTSERDRYKALIQRRRAHEPVAYLLGYREFFGRRFQVDSRVLIPRPDTEALVSVALERSRPRAMQGRLLDLCCGSGCVTISFARERPTWSILGADISSDALVVARRNALRLGAVWGVSWHRGDLFAALPPGTHCTGITANPPYIPTAELETLDADVRDHEPRLALDGGVSGTQLLERIVSGARAVLEPGGFLALEVMSGQAPVVSELLLRAGFHDVKSATDYGGHERVVSGLSP